MPVVKKNILLGMTALILFFCATSKDLRSKFERDPLVAVVYGLKPKGAPPTMQIVYDAEGIIGQNFPENFAQTAESVKEAIAESWSLPRTYVVQNRAQFEADLVSGVWLKGYYVPVRGYRYKFVCTAYVVFMDERMREYLGKEEGYLVAQSESSDFEVKEVKSFLDRGMKRQAFEQLLRFIPPEKILPELQIKIKEGTKKLMEEIKQS